MKKNVTLTALFFVLFLVTTPLFGQQTMLSNFHRYNWQLVNPAAVDRLQMFNQHQTLLNASVRQQWLGFEGSPVNYYLSFEHMPHINSSFSHRIKWGFNVFKDQADQIGSYGISGNFGYYIQLSSKQKFLHFAISPSLVQYQVNLDEIKFKQATVLAEDDYNRLYADFSFGVFYRQISNRNKAGFYMGLSIPQSFALRLEQREEDSGIFAPERVRHVYAIAGGFIRPGKYSPFRFEPSTWLRYVPGLNYSTSFSNLPISMDANLRTYFLYDRGTNNSVWAGLGYGTNRNMKVEIGVNQSVGQILGDSDGLMRFAFSWELPLLSDGLNLGQSIELNLTYAWD